MSSAEHQQESILLLQAAASAPGKAILFGEHAVVHGQPAIAVSLDELRIYTFASSRSDGKVVLQLPDLAAHHDDCNYTFDAVEVCTQQHIHNSNNNNNSDDDDDNVEKPSSQEVQNLIGLLKEAIKDKEDEEVDELSLAPLVPLLFLLRGIVPFLLNESRGVKIVCRSADLPVGAGLGSSAAFCVATSAALYQLKRLNQNLNKNNKIIQQPSSEELNKINAWAFAAEAVVHGNPSGLDNTISCFGGAILYEVHDREVKIQNINNLPPIKIILTNTHVPRSTRVLVGHVGNLYKKFPDIIGGVFNTIGGISREFHRLIMKNENNTDNDGSSDETISRLIRLNQLMLRAIEVSHPSLEDICSLTEGKFGVSTKLTGAGGGGCALTFVGRHNDCTIEEVKTYIEASLPSMSCLTSSICGSGVLYVDYSSFN